MRRLVVIACALAGGAGLLLAGPASGGDGGPYDVRAIFDNASFLVQGEEVRVAGAKVGEVTEVEVTRPGEIASLEGGGKDEPGKAAVVMRIDDPGFQDFREDASCLIQPQSLLGEKFVGCKPTQPRAPGTEPPPPLEEIPEDQPGAGQLLLPLESNGKAVDLDLVNNIMREPYPDRFRLILNDLGAGLAARGKDLEEIVERSNPALRQTERVLSILARQNRALARLARDSDTVLAPLARERRSITGFIRGANETAQATAERRGELEAGLERFPGFLRELRSTMIDLRRFSDRGTPVLRDFGIAAPDLTRATRATGPLADAATKALTTLGDAAEEAEDDLIASDPVIRDVRDLAEEAEPGAKQLKKLLGSLRQTDGFEALMDFIFNTSSAVNGFDEYGTYLRTFSLVTNCVAALTTTPITGCEALFDGGGGSSASTAAASKLPEPLGSGKKRRGERGKSDRGKKQRNRSAGKPQADPKPAPAEPLGPGEDAESGGPGADPKPTSSRRPGRAGKALLRFLTEDGA